MNVREGKNKACWHMPCLQKSESGFCWSWWNYLSLPTHHPTPNRKALAFSTQSHSAFQRLLICGKTTIEISLLAFPWTALRSVVFRELYTFTCLDLRTWRERNLVAFCTYATIKSFVRLQTDNDTLTCCIKPWIQNCTFKPECSPPTSSYMVTELILYTFYLRKHFICQRYASQYILT